MATLVLTTLGTALGGPVGGALGSIVGQSIDRNLFGPAARRGPRLGDLSVQTSSYGTPIARIYGRMRVAGTVVWASDLREEEVVSGGKGAPGAIAYAYSASFAVALSSRPAKGVGRIWADGKLLRGADGTFKTRVTHRFHPGDEGQLVDPLIGSIEGADGAPAFRGIALAVFEDMALADYGNRIPSLTFELIADEEAPRVDAVISDVSGGTIEEGNAAASVGGFAALGSDRRAAIEPLVDLWGRIYQDDGEMLRFTDRAAPAILIGDAASAGCVLEGERHAPRIEREQEAADGLPAALTIEYYDPKRDYQAGQMRATLSTGGRSQRRIDSAAALGAGAAKSLASDALARRWAGRDRIRLRLAPGFMGLRPGQLVLIKGVPGRYRIEEITIDGMVVVVGARRIASGESALAADAGRGNLDPDLATGKSMPILLDLPAAGERDGFGVTLALGSDGRFKPTPVVVEANGQPLASLRVDRAAIVGVTTTVLLPGTTNVIDGINSVEVRLSNPQALLYHADDDALAMGANMMRVGSELIQFGRAVAIGAGLYRLSTLARGRRGSEWAVRGHLAGENVVLLDQASLVRVPMDRAMIGALVEVRAFGVADDDSDPPRFSLAASGESLRPMAPCHLQVELNAMSCALRWVPRRLDALGWSAFPEPGGAASFLVTVRRGVGVLTRVNASPAIDFPVAELDALGAGPVEFEVVEQGVVPSRPAVVAINL